MTNFFKNNDIAIILEINSYLLPMDQRRLYTVMKKIKTHHNDLLILQHNVTLCMNTMEEYNQYIQSNEPNNFKINLNLSGCWATDVSTLCNVHTLNLLYCSNLVNVTALGNVHNLNLSCCEKIVDVGALGNVHTLNLSGCSNLVNVSALGNEHTLN
jgi:hypothetical protein